MWKKWCSIFWMLGFCLGGNGIVLVENGKSGYVIYSAADATAVEKNAAAELQEYVEKITGCRLPVVAAVPDGTAKVVFVGDSAAARRAVPEYWPEAWRQDEILIAVDPAGPLVLAGDAQRGALYAVDTWLEDWCGVRWWTWHETEIPSLPTLELEPQCRRYAPVFSLIRQVFYPDVNEHPQFLAHLKLDGARHHPLPPEWGGSNSIFCHTQLSGWQLAPETYFADHPEWYAERDGKRVPDGQLCLTNPAMRREMIRKVKENLRALDGAKVVDCSQADNQTFCCCATCRAAEEALGGHSGLMIDFINAVAAGVEQEFPAAIVCTFAYEYTRRPPDNPAVRPRHNVMIRLCPIECNLARPYDSTPEQCEVNSEFAADLKRWSEIAPHLMIWDYWANFIDPLIPSPLWGNVAGNLRFMAANKVTAVLAEHWAPAFGEFTALHQWVGAHLLWNPDLDAAELTREFVTGYYGGAAAPYILDYLALQQREIDSHPKFHLSIFTGGTSGWLSLPAIERMRKLMAEAAETVAADPVLSRRVARLKIPADVAYLTRPEFTVWSALQRIDRRTPEQPPAELIREVVDNIKACIAETKALGPCACSGTEDCVLGYSRSVCRMGMDVEAFAAALKDLYRTEPLPLPLPLPDGLKETECVVVPATDFSRNADAVAVEDPPGSPFPVLRIATRKLNWLTFRYGILPETPVRPGLSFDLWALLRVEKATTRPVLWCGIWYPLIRQELGFRVGVEGTHWQWVKLGNIPFLNRAQPFLAGLEVPEAEYLYCAAIVLAPPAGQEN